MKLNLLLEFRSIDRIVHSNKSNKDFYIINLEDTQSRPIQVLTKKEDFDKTFKSFPKGKQAVCSLSTNNLLFLDNLQIKE